MRGEEGWVMGRGRLGCVCVCFFFFLLLARFSVLLPCPVLGHIFTFQEFVPASCQLKNLATFL